MIDGNKNITAHFAEGYRLTLSASPTNGGTVWQDLIQGKEISPGFYTMGSVVQIGAQAAAGTNYKFIYWTGDIGMIDPNQNPVNITMYEDKDITAYFAQVVVLRTEVSPQNTGTIDVQLMSGTEISPGVYTLNSVLELTATANMDWEFSRWLQGVPQGSELENPVYVTMNDDRYVIAGFRAVIEYYTLNITINPVNGGSVTKEPDSIQYPAGTRVVITAFPAGGFSFSHWSGDASGTTIETEVIMDYDKYVTANFIQGLGYLTVSGQSSMQAGDSNDLTVVAYNAQGIVDVNYNGYKNLTFSGPGVAPNGTVPTVEGVNIGQSVSVYFASGISINGTATLRAYKAEVTTVDVSDGQIDSYGDTSYDLDLTVTPDNIDSLNFTVQPVDTEAGQKIGGNPVEPSVEVELLDVYGNLCTNDTSTIVMTIGSNPGGGTLSGNLQSNAVNGIAEFFTLSIDKAGQGYTLIATKEYTSINTTSQSFNITSGATAAALKVRKQIDESANGDITAGGSLELKVIAVDSSGNVATDYSGYKALIFMGPSPALDGTEPTVEAVNIGQTVTVLFTDDKSNLNVATLKAYLYEAVMVDVDDGTINSWQHPNYGFNLSVNPASLDNLNFKVQPSNTLYGTTISPDIEVELRDQYNNVLYNDNTTDVAIEIGNNPAGGTLSGTLARTSQVGVAKFNDLSIDNPGSDYTLEAYVGVIRAASQNFDITSGSGNLPVIDYLDQTTVYYHHNYLRIYGSNFGGVAISNYVRFVNVATGAIYYYNSTDEEFFSSGFWQDDEVVIRYILIPVGTYKVQIITAEGASNEKDLEVLPWNQPAPEDFIATAVSPSQIDLSWTDKSWDGSGNELNFELERGLDDVNYSPLAIPAQDTTSYIDTQSLLENTTYYYRLRAVYPHAPSDYVYANATTPSNYLPIILSCRAIEDWGPDGEAYKVNGDGWINPGEKIIGLEIELKNVGIFAITNVDAVLETQDQDINFIRNNALYPDIASGEFQAGVDNFLLGVTDSVEDGRVVNFELDISSNEGSWTQEFAITVTTPFSGLSPREINLQPQEVALKPGIQPGIPHFVTNIGAYHDNNGNVYRVSVDASAGLGDIYFARSKDYGLTWLDSIRLDTDPAGSASSSKPQLAFDNQGNIYVVWCDNREEEDYGVYFNCSYDYGQTWLSEDVRITPIGLDPRIVCDNSGNIYLTYWQNDTNYYSDQLHRHTDRVLFGHSDDYGVTWGDHKQISDYPYIEGPDVINFDANHPEMACDESGHVYVVWQDSGYGSYTAVDFDYNDNYGSRYSWHDDQELDTFPMSNLFKPKVNCDNNGNVYAMWYDSRSDSYRIYFNCSRDNGVTWKDDADILNTNQPGTSQRYNPYMASDELGNVFVAWKDNRNDSGDIYFNYSRDYGDSWGANDVRLDTDPIGSASSYSPTIECDKRGNAYFVWTRYDGATSERLLRIFAEPFPSLAQLSDKEVDEGTLLEMGITSGTSKYRELMISFDIRELSVDKQDNVNDNAEVTNINYDPGTGYTYGTFRWTPPEPSSEGLYDPICYFIKDASSGKCDYQDISINVLDGGQTLYNLTVNYGSGSGDYAQGTVVNISANDAPAGQVFDKWTGDTAYVGDVNAADTTVTMPEDNVSVTATYIDVYTLTVTKNPINGGSVSINLVSGKFISPDKYTANSVLDLTAVRAVGYMFVDYSGDIPAGSDGRNNPLRITMNSNKEITANFVMLGDVKEDTSISMTDAIQTAEASIGLRTLTYRQEKAADVDGNGLIQMVDAIIIAEYAIGLRNTWPIDE